MLCPVARDTQDNAFINFFPDHSQREAKPDHVGYVVLFLFRVTVMESQTFPAFAFGAPAPPLVFLDPLSALVPVVLSQWLRSQSLVFGMVAHSELLGRTGEN